MKSLRRALSNTEWNVASGVCLGLLVITFMMGGGARADIQSLILLRPLAVMALGWGLWRLWQARSDDLLHLRRYRGLLIGAAVIVAFNLLQLIPLPPQIWQNLAGRDVPAAVDAVVGHDGVWRPLAMVVQGGWNSLFSLAVPLAMLVWAIQLDGAGRARLLSALLLIGLATGVVGILQTVGGAQSPLYFYRITNGGSAVGLFANRNHQALYLAMMLPMLASYASLSVRRTEEANFRRWMAIAGGMALIPLILVTGSRGGLLMAVIGLASIPVLYRAPRGMLPARRHGGMQLATHPWLLGGLAVLALGAITFFASRARALERLFSSEDGDDLRMQLWPEVARMIGDYFPWGSGLGSFAEVFKIHEPDWALDASYFNHAHNDYLELVLSAGLPGLLVLLGAFWLLGRYGFAAFRQGRGGQLDGDAVFGRLGAVLLAMFATASAFDYPLRVPSMMALFVIASVWLAASFSRGLVGASSRSEM